MYKVNKISHTAISEQVYYMEYSPSSEANAVWVKKLPISECEFMEVRVSDLKRTFSTVIEIAFFNDPIIDFQLFFIRETNK
jgi:hypothetical protein